MNNLGEVDENPSLAASSFSKRYGEINLQSLTLSIKTIAVVLGGHMAKLPFLTARLDRWCGAAMLFAGFVMLHGLLFPRAGAVFATPPECLLGEVLPGSLTNFQFMIVNDTDRCQEVFHVDPGCSCTKVQLENSTLLPKTSTPLNGAFRARRAGGQQVVDVRVLFRDAPDAEPQMLDLCVSANVVPAIVAAPAVVRFSPSKAVSGSLMSVSISLVAHGKVLDAGECVSDVRSDHPLISAKVEGTKITVTCAVRPSDKETADRAAAVFVNFNRGEFDSLNVPVFLEESGQ